MTCILPALKLNILTYVAYLFATKAGISKVGTYLDTNGNQNIDCGFTAAEVTTDDSIDTYVNGSNAGFTVKQNATTNLNLYATISTASYIYLAIA